MLLNRVNTSVVPDIEWPALRQCWPFNIRYY
ncbi:tail fiber assembly protein [Escherichia coli]